MLSSIILIPLIFAPSLAHFTKQRKTEAQEARILPAAEECTPYSLPAVEAIVCPGSYLLLFHIHISNSLLIWVL